jgi:hypothetical protein
MLQELVRLVVVLFQRGNAIHFIANDAATQQTHSCAMSGIGTILLNSEFSVGKSTEHGIVAGIPATKP